MNKIVSFACSLCVASSLLCTPFFVSAQTIDANSTGLAAAGAKTGLTKFCSGTGQACLLNIIGNLISVALGTLGIILLGYLLYAGFLWMTSGGEDKKVGQARTMIRNAIVGLIIIVASVAISNFVLGALINVAKT